MKVSQALAHIEVLMDQSQAQLLANNPQTMEAAMQQLRQGMTAFVELVQRFSVQDFSDDDVRKMQQISERLTHMRGHIARMGALNAQQLATLVPQQAAGGHTYGAKNQPPGAAAAVARLYHFSG